MRARTARNRRMSGCLTCIFPCFRAPKRRPWAKRDGKSARLWGIWATSCLLTQSIGGTCGNGYKMRQKWDKNETKKWDKKMRQKMRQKWDKNVQKHVQKYTIQLIHTPNISSKTPQNTPIHYKNTQKTPNSPSKTPNLPSKNPEFTMKKPLTSTPSPRKTHTAHLLIWRTSNYNGDTHLTRSNRPKWPKNREKWHFWPWKCGFRAEIAPKRHWKCKLDRPGKAARKIHRRWTRPAHIYY
jgi:hypothetical protein